jgi:hypothetical protein
MMGTAEIPRGLEAARLDGYLAHPPRTLDGETRTRIWASAGAILGHGPLAPTGNAGASGLALGYVQSGKTTSITALVALAADSGYRVIVALLGVTNLLLDQNTSRIEESLGIGERNDYRWVVLKNPRGHQGARELHDWLDRGRVVMVPVLKHAGRIRALAGVLAEAGAGTLPVLIIDDEADQASLNNQVNENTQSETYAAITVLKAAVPTHLYTQYTATPYAPLLIEPDDHLAPDFVEILEPGPGYTGGREFFIDEADRVIRAIPTTDEQPPRGLPMALPSSLVSALSNFVAGAALLLAHDTSAAPVSMLVHSTYKNDVQERYRFLLERKLKQWARSLGEVDLGSQVPLEILVERDRLIAAGVADIPVEVFAASVGNVVKEATLWLVNSASDVKKIDWNVAPVHILVGGNKLDRGYTVEGLTVSYMNRPASPQIDTLEQRARAFGYRRDLLPYCQFFAGPRTLESLRGVVFTEYDLRAELLDWLDAGGSISGWAQHIGLMLPAGTRPTRDSVITAVSRFNQGGEGWHSLRRPDTSSEAVASNRRLIDALGLQDAPPANYGRLAHRTLTGLSPSDLVDRVLAPWMRTSYSPGWRHADIVQFLGRLPADGTEATVVLMEREGGGPRERRWDPELGFVNLFQGPDLDFRPGTNTYPGDRNLFDRAANPGLVELQVHRVHQRGSTDLPELFTLAINLGAGVVVRRSSS